MFPTQASSNLSSYPIQGNFSFQPQQIKSDIYEIPPPSQLPPFIEQAINLVQAPSPMPQEELAREMEVVEELVRSRAQNLPDWTDDDNSSESGTSISSDSCSPRSETSDMTSNYSIDDDWSLKSSNNSSDKKSNNGKIKTNRSENLPNKKKRTYGRSTEDRCYRKKEQNKNAANRYRLKKKAEIEIILEEERDLIKKNDELQVQFSDVKREVKYLKSLMRELYQAKGLLN